MAANDTAALVVALSAQISKFEKDLNAAVAIADKKTKEIESKFTATNKEIINQLSRIASNAAGNIGGLASILSSLGPAGFAAAAALGVAAGGIYALIEATERFAEKSKILKEGAETAGFSITQFKLLGQAGKRVGLDFEETSSFFTKFILNMEALRNGGGPLFDALLKIDRGLLLELSTTKDSAKAVDLLVAAYIRLTDQTQKLALSKAAGGKGGLSGGRLLESLGPQGGLSGLVANSPAIDEGVIERAAQLSIEIDAIKKSALNIYGSMFSDFILGKQKQQAELFRTIAEYIDRIVRGKKESQTLDEQEPAPGRAPLQITVPALPRANFAERFTGREGSPAAPKEGSPSVALAILRKDLAVLGDAITQGEQWKQKQLEIAAAAEKEGISQGIANRALSAFNVAMQAAALATRERLSIATEQQITDVKLLQLQQDKIKFALTEKETQQATVVILREAKDAADALAVRRSYLPGLKQLELDAKNLRKGLDELAVSSLNSVTDGLADIVTGTKKASEAFKDMSNAIIRDLARLVIRQSVTAPLAGLIAGGLGGLGGLIPATRAGGGPVSFGKSYIVGENGPELFRPSTSGYIVSNGSGGGGGGGSGGQGGVTIENHVHNNAGVAVRQETTRTNGGGFRIDTIIDQVAGKLASQVAKGGSPLNLAYEGRYGLSPARGNPR